MSHTPIPWDVVKRRLLFGLPMGLVLGLIVSGILLYGVWEWVR